MASAKQGVLRGKVLLMIVILFTQLAYCVVQFLEKDASLTEPVSGIRPVYLLPGVLH